MSLDDAFDLTPDLQAAAREAMGAFRIGPLYTPPSLEGSLVRPGGSGVANWGGGAFRPRDRVSLRQGLEPAVRDAVGEFDPETTTNPFADTTEPAFVGYDTAFGARATFEGGIPLNKPPYAYLVAIDLDAGDIVWRVPFGRGSDGLRSRLASRGLDVPDRLGTPGPQARS